MTPEQIEIAAALGRVTYLPGSSEKRFGRNMAFLAEHSPEQPISERQDSFMRQLAWRFRRQIPAKLVPPEKPEPMPPKPESKRRDRSPAAHERELPMFG